MSELVFHFTIKFIKVVIGVTISTYVTLKVVDLYGGFPVQMIMKELQNER